MLKTISVHNTVLYLFVTLWGEDIFVSHVKINCILDVLTGDCR